MDRVIVAMRRWEALERRRFPVAVPLVVVRLAVAALLLLVAWNLLRDIAYLRAIPARPIAIDDTFAYECYARAFWHGPHALADAARMRFCADHRWAFWTSAPRAFHTLPREYPAPSLAVFSLPLLWPAGPYDLVYMVLMALVVWVATAWLALRRLAFCAAAFALYVLVGGWATALDRFDLVPGMCVLGALVLAERRRFGPAYLLLAAASLLKIYPALLVPALAIHQWRATRLSPRRDLALFAVAVAAGLLPGLLLNPSGFLGPLRYNTLRPPQIESVAGSLLWLSGRVGGDVHVRLTYHSVNVLGTFDGLAAWLATVALLGGVLLVYRRAWRGVDDPARSFVLILLVTLCGSKLLSPQYLLWLFPIVAYVEGLRLRWALVAVLTVAIYPHAYTLDQSLIRLPDHPLFMTAILSRNAALIAITAAYLRLPRLLPDTPSAPLWR